MQSLNALTNPGCGCRREWAAAKSLNAVEAPCKQIPSKVPKVPSLLLYPKTSSDRGGGSMFGVVLTDRISTSTKKRSFQTLNLEGFFSGISLPGVSCSGLQQHKLSVL